MLRCGPWRAGDGDVGWAGSGGCGKRDISFLILSVKSVS